MLTITVLTMLSQVPAEPRPPAVTSEHRVSWSDGTRSHLLFESAFQLAERSPTEAMKARVLAIDPSAVVLLQTATMRIWSVGDAARVSRSITSLRPVLHDIAPETGNWKVALSLVCHGEERPMSSRDVLSRSGTDGCLPNFWYPAQAQ